MGELNWLNGRYGSQKKVVFSFVLALSSFFFSLTSTAGASTFDSHFRIRVVPLECIIEEINNGITEEYFLGPSECEDLINPPIITPPSPEPSDKAARSGSDTEAALPLPGPGQVFLAPAEESAKSGKSPPSIKQPLINLGNYEFLNTPLAKINFFLLLAALIFIAILYLLSGRVRSPIEKLLTLLVIWRK